MLGETHTMPRGEHTMRRWNCVWGLVAGAQIGARPGPGPESSREWPGDLMRSATRRFRS